MNVRELVAVAAICGAVALPSYADTNITEHVMLTEDADWTSLGTVNIAADAGIHLNGYNLTVAGFAGGGSIYSSTLPPGYARLEYVESTGAQYIDTGVIAYSEGKVEGDVMFTGSSTSVYRMLVGASLNSGNSNSLYDRHYGVWVWNGPYNVGYNGVQYGSSKSAERDVRRKIVAAWNNTTAWLTVDGAGKTNTFSKVTPTTVNYPMYLFARNKGGTATEKANYRVYSFKIYKPQTTLVRNYVPAKRLSDEKVGLYDMVSGTFSPSATETAFNDGPEVERSGGELRINVASDTFQNSTVAISNSVKVVKTGAGSYKSSKTQSYTGGTAVNGGKVQSTVEHGFGAAGTAFSISNARVDIEGRNNTLRDYDVTIEDAGTAEVIQGASKITGGSGYQKSFLKSLTLSGDASIGVWQEDAFGLTHNTGSIQPFTLTLNGHTLTIQGNNRLCANRVTVTDEGTINVRRTQGTSNTQFYPRGILNAPLVTLDIGANAKMYGDEGFVVSNLVFSGTGGSKSTTVLGRYSPKVNSSLPTVVLGDATHHAPTLDLRGVSAAIGGVSFADGSTVAVDVGSRTVNVGDPLVLWSAGEGPDSTVSFTLLANGAAPENLALVVRENEEYHGLYVKSTLTPAYAEWDVENDGWKFYMADGSLYPGEWTDGVTSDMQVRFSSYEEYTAIKAKDVSPSMFVMTGFTMPEGLGEVDATVGMAYQFDEGIVIDIKGNSLKLPSSMMFGDKAFTVTSSVAGGEVVIDVPSGTSRNTSMTLAGSLKVTKKGAGMFVSALSQTYTGGTDVEAGTVRPPDSPADNNYTYSGDTFTAFGTGMVNVLPGAVFDVRGNYAYTNIVLKGGTIANTLRVMDQTAKPGVFVASLADADVSYFNMYLSGAGNQYATSYGRTGLATDLGGKTLEIVEWGNLSLRSALTNGTVRVVESNGWFRFEAALDMSTTTFDNLCALQVNANVQLGEYISRKNTQYMLGTGRLFVHKRFCPVAETYFFNCTMQDGAMLDLSQRETLFTASCTNHQNNVCTLSFADNANITVNLAGRTDLKAVAKSESPYVVKWPSKPTNGATFALDPQTAAARYSIVPDVIGLRLKRARGTMVIVR